jgi:hypothetical protein
MSCTNISVLALLRQRTHLLTVLPEDLAVQRAAFCPMVFAIDSSDGRQDRRRSRMTRIDDSLRAPATLALAVRIHE